MVVVIEVMEVMDAIEVMDMAVKVVIMVKKI
jgi:hypothetical protein